MSTKKLKGIIVILLLATAAMGQRVELLSGMHGNTLVTKRVECINCEGISETLQIRLIGQVFREIQFATDKDRRHWALYLKTLNEFRGTSDIKMFIDDTNFFLRDHYMR